MTQETRENVEIVAFLALILAALVAFFWFCHCYQVAFDIEAEKIHEQDLINSCDPYFAEQFR